MERIDRDTWRTDNGDEVRARGLRVTVEFGEKTKAEVLCAVEAVRAENAKLLEQLESLPPKDCEGNILDIADTVHMLRSEYDGDHEWDDVVVELALTKWGGDRWIVRGSKGEAWAYDCLRTGYDEDAYEGSDDAEPIVNPTLIEAENAKLRRKLEVLKAHGIEIVDAVAGGNEIYSKEHARVESLEVENAKLRDFILMLMNDEVCPRCVKPYCTNPKDGRWSTCDYDDCLRELGIEVDDDH